MVHIPFKVVLGTYMTQKLHASRETGLKYSLAFRQRESNMKTCFQVMRIKMLV